MNTKHFNIVISGQVHNIGFRYLSKEKADQLGLRGFVRNELKGQVYIEVEGEEEILQKFIDWARTGPQGAIIEKFDIKEFHTKVLENGSIPLGALSSTVNEWIDTKSN